MDVAIRGALNVSLHSMPVSTKLPKMNMYAFSSIVVDDANRR